MHVEAPISWLDLLEHPLIRLLSSLYDMSFDSKMIQIKGRKNSMCKLMSVSFNSYGCISTVQRVKSQRNFAEKDKGFNGSW